jgi:predicted metalloprotease with PDZ domain
MKINRASYFRIFLTITSILLFNCKSEKTNLKSKESISYTVTFDANNKKLARIKATFTPTDSILFMGWGANNLPKRWATFVHNVKAINKQNQPVKIQELDDARWQIKTSLDEEITLSYEVHLDHENYDWSSGIDAVAYTTELGVFYTGRTLFILNGEERKNINVSFNLPEKWKVTNPWITKQRDNQLYQAANNIDLQTALIFAGTHKEISIKREDFELVFALGTEDILSQEVELKSLAQGVLDYYIDLMGGIPNPSPDNPLSKSVVVISSSDKTDGEAMGNNISVLIEKNGDELAKTISRFIFAHEFFHLWSGKSFSPASDDTEWFKEGFTNYYTLKALHHVNFLTDESYIDFLSSFFYKRYDDDEGVGKYSMADGEKKHEHWGLVYAGGMLVGISQDMIIRNATNNEKSIDDLMRYLFKKYGGSNNTYTSEELQIVMTELSGINQTNFFNLYVLGKDKIPVDTFLVLAGLNSKIENGILMLSKKEKLNSKEKSILKGLFGYINSKS